MTYEIENFQKEKKKLRRLALGNGIVILISISITLACYYTNQSSYCLFFGVISGLTGAFLLLVGAERMELSANKRADNIN